MQVIHELRDGVKLRKTSKPNQYIRHIEYELTPFEILLDQIRTRRYRLRKIGNQSLAREIKKNARDIILDFIRSRPPLKPVVKCVKQRTEPLTMHEKLMQSIRTYSVPTLRKASLNTKLPGMS
jgi:spire-like protein